MICEHCIRAWIILYNVTSEYNSAFVFFAILVPTSNSWDDMSPLMTRSALFCLLSLLHWSLLFLFLPFVSCHPGMFSSFSHSLSTAASASAVFVASSTGKTCSRECSGSMDWFLSLQCGLHDRYVEILPNAFSWIRRLQRCMRILSWEHQECDKFPCIFFPWSCKA